MLPSVGISAPVSTRSTAIQTKGTICRMYGAYTPKQISEHLKISLEEVLEALDEKFLPVITFEGLEDFKAYKYIDWADFRRKYGN